MFWINFCCYFFTLQSTVIREPDLITWPRDFPFMSQRIVSRRTLSGSGPRISPGISHTPLGLQIHRMFTFLRTLSPHLSRHGHQNKILYGVSCFRFMPLGHILFVVNNGVQVSSLHQGITLVATVSITFYLTPAICTVL